MLGEAAALTTQILGEIIPADKPGVLSLAMRQPAGVVLGMAPWNAPVILGVRAIAAPLACGNTVILKSSEVCPATHRLIGQIMNDVGFPKGVVNVISNAPDDAPKVRSAKAPKSQRAASVTARSSRRRSSTARRLLCASITRSRLGR
jgi:vanillin dehydrogenase